MLHAVAVGGDELTVHHIKGAGVDGEIQGVGLGVAADGGDTEDVWLDDVAPRAGAGASGVVEGVAVHIEGRGAVDGGDFCHMVAVIPEQRALLAVVVVIIDGDIAHAVDDALLHDDI